MGRLRSGFSFVVALFAAVVFIVVFAFLGSFIPLFSSAAQLFNAAAHGALIGGGIGALIGLFLMIRTRRQSPDMTWLKKHGTRIIANVTEIERRSESYLSGSTTQYRTYYVVVASWINPQTRQIHIFRSERRSFSPQNYAPGSNISILIDPQNYQRYLVEV